MRSTPRPAAPLLDDLRAAPCTVHYSCTLRSMRSCMVHPVHCACNSEQSLESRLAKSQVSRVSRVSHDRGANPGNGTCFPCKIQEFKQCSGS